jgi:hypothetical protein
MSPKAGYSTIFVKANSHLTCPEFSMQRPLSQV